MRRVLAVLFLGLVWVTPALSQAPCPPDVWIPVGLQVAPPICPGQPLRLVARACGPCVDLVTWTFMPPGPIQIHASLNPANCILAVCQPESLEIPLGSFAAGHHLIVVEVRGTVMRPDGTSCVVVRRDSVRFDVPLSCKPPAPLPYTDVIRVGPPPPCATCPPPPICPDREIPFFIAGHFPDDCYTFMGLKLLPSPIASPRPQPPVARVTVGVNDCLGMPCRMVDVPWKAGALMPALPPGDYFMIVELQEVSRCDSTRSLALHTTSVPFTVARTCSLPPAPGCFLYGWRPNPADPGCNTRVAPGTPGRLVLDVRPFEPLAGLQGRLALEPPALRIGGLRAIGPAAGMRLVWRELPDGASFALYAESGAPIRPPADCAAIDCSSVPVLEVIVEPRPSSPIPALTTLRPVDLLATDAQGRELRPCPTFAEIPPAHICAGASCDFNRDGRVDIRDLVLMARCVRDPVACPDSTESRFDCNGDGTFGMDDVLCCARVIFHGRMPGGTATRPSPQLMVSVGDVATTATGTDVPVRIHRADLVGAARLAFSYSADRFAGVAVELAGDASRWLQVSEASGGELIVGLIATAPAEMAADLDLRLHFDLASGQSPSTAIGLLESEFAGPDGMPLAAGTGTTSVPPAAIRLKLSPARPNPFTGETRFVLGVTRATDADLGVFDLSGRRVATLHRGSLEAGEHTFRWDGTTRGGARAKDGVYIYRARASGVSATGKLVLLHAR